jgi:UDPglucose 6-dehydrogenase
VVQAYDPVAMEEARRVLPGTPGLRFVTSGWMPALEGADALLVVTEWKEIRNPDFDAIKATLKQPVILDGRNLYEPALMKTVWNARLLGHELEVGDRASSRRDFSPVVRRSWCR